jgi:hypothetical protein
MDVAFREYLFLIYIYKIVGKLGGGPLSMYGFFLRFDCSRT